MKVLLIGYGSIGKRHFQVLSKLSSVNKIDIVTRQHIKKVTVYKDLTFVKDIKQYDYFVIASETYRHFNQLSYINKNVKNKIILVEKPLFSENKKFISKNNNSIFIGYNLRFHPVLHKIKSEIKNKKVLYVNILAGQYLPSWRPDADYRKSYSASKKKGGGVLLDLSHEIDYIQWLFGDITDLSSINKKISDLEIDSDDIVTVIGETEKAVIINFTLDYINKIGMRRVIIYLNEKIIIGDLIENTIIIKSNYSKEKIIKFKFDKDFTYKELHKNLLNNNYKNACPLKEALKVMQIIERIKKNK